MGNSVNNCLELIGLCLAPLEEDRVPLLEESARKIEDWESMLRLCGARYVSPLVFARIQGANLEHLIPGKVRSRFHRLYLLTAILNALRLNQSLIVNSILRDRGIKTLYFKGTTLVMAGDYTDPGHRMFADVDWLANKQDIEELRQAFSEAGDWRELPIHVMQGWEVTPWVNSWGTMVEVHWNLKPHNGVPSPVSERRLWSHAQEIDYRGKKALIPCAEDRFIQAALHSTVHHTFDTSYLFVTISDLAHLAGRAAGNFDWSRIVEELRVERMLEHVAVAMDLAWELTRYKPLAEGLAVIKARVPELEAVTAPLVKALLRVVQKPWLFHSFYERRLFAKKSYKEWARYIFDGFNRRLFPEPAKRHSSTGEVVEVEGVISKAQYKRKIWDFDFLNYLLELYRFDRQINYKINI
jgi:hypothetical protein